MTTPAFTSRPSADRAPTGPDHAVPDEPTSIPGDRALTGGEVPVPVDRARPREHTPVPLDPTLLSVARTQLGMLTTAQAAGVGLSAPMLVALVKSGVLRHPGRGLYAVEALAQPEPQAWHRQLCAGALLLYPDAVLAGTSAVLAHGIPVWGAPIGRPSILRPVSRTGGMNAFWVRPTRGEVVSTAWGPASDPATALVQHAVDHGIVTGVVSADAALREGIVSLEQLTTRVAEVATWPHSSRAASMLRLVDGRRESVGESRCGVTLAMAGIAVTPQVTITDASGSFAARVDFLVDGTMVVVEFDGKVKYAAGDPEVLWHEKRREDRLRALGYVVVRVTWAQLERPGAVAAAVRAAVAAR